MNEAALWVVGLSGIGSMFCIGMVIRYQIKFNELVETCFKNQKEWNELTDEQLDMMKEEIYREFDKEGHDNDK